MAEISQNDMNYLLDGYRKRGLSAEILELAEKDLQSGLSKYMVEIYAAKKVDTAHAKAVSEAFHLGATSKLAHRIISLDEYRMNLVMKELKGGMTEDKIMEVLSKDAPVHGLQELFDQVKADVSKAKAKEEQVKEKPEAGNKAEGENEKEPEHGNNQAAASFSPDDIAKAMEPMLERLLEGRLNHEIDRLEQRVEELQGDLASSAGVIKSKEDEIVRLREEMDKMKALQETRDAPEKSVKTEESVTAQSNDGISKEAYLEANLAKMKGEATSFATNRKTDNADMSHVAGNYQTYLTTADGRKIAVQIEHTKARKPKGMLALMSNLFSGTPSQKALINMLIDSRLNPSQLQEIKRAKDNHFSDEELKDLIESDLPADEMSGIIDVIISDR